MNMSNDISGIDVHKLFSMNLKRLRTKACYSQLSLANTVGLTHNFINDIENGKKWVSPKTIAKLANALKIDPYLLFLPPYQPEENDAQRIKGYLDDISDSFIKAVSSLKAQYLPEEKQAD